MTPIFSVLVIITLALFIIRVASVALTLTGVSEELARFQARSAFTGTGFTTDEANSVVEHPVRRRIISALMLMGSAGILSAISSLVVSFADVERGTALPRVGVLLLGITILWLLSRSRWLERVLDRLIAKALDRWTSLRVRDYANILHLREEYRVGELEVEEEDWLASRSLKELNLGKEGVHILGITRAQGKYIGAPQGETQIKAGDRLVIYGRGEVLDELDERKSGPHGEGEHHASVQREEERRRREGE